MKNLNLDQPSANDAPRQPAEAGNPFMNWFHRVEKHLLPVILEQKIE